MRTTAAPAAEPATPSKPAATGTKPTATGTKPAATGTKPAATGTKPTVEPAAEPAAEPAETTPGDRRPSKGKRVIIRDDFLVEGRLEKPSAYYLLRRSALDYDWARLDAKFSPLVLESVQDPLF